MKRYSYPVRFTIEIHEALRLGAIQCGVSMHAHVCDLLDCSLLRHPIIECLPAMRPATKTFGVRFKPELHDALLNAAHLADAERSFNQEVVGRLILMLAPSSAAVMDAWAVLSEFLDEAVNFLPLERSRELVEARERLEKELVRGFSI